jgi:hypothetical protein
MALVRNPADSEALSGRVGNTIYCRKGGGTYTRRRPAPSYVPTPARSLHHSSIAELIGVWQSFTPEHKASWQEWANLHPRTNVFGHLYTLSGYAAYISRALLVIETLSTTLQQPYPDLKPALVRLLDYEAGGGGGVDLHTTSHHVTPTPAWLDVWAQSLPHLGRAGTLTKAKRISLSTCDDIYVGFSTELRGPYALFARYINAHYGTHSNWMTLTVDIT